jgi:hypothetical protein
MVLMVVLAAVRLVFSKPQQLEVRQALLPLQFKVLLVAVLPPLQVHRAQGLVRVAVVHRKREIPKMQILAVLVVTVLLIVFLAHLLHTQVAAVAVAVATMLKRVALEEQAVAVLAAQ